MFHDQFVDEGATQFDLSCHFDNFKLHMLKLGDGTSKRVSFLAILDGEIQYKLRGDHRADCAN